MSYEIYKHRDNTVRDYERWLISLVGKGEHEGTIVTIPQEQMLARKLANETDLAVYLDNTFLRAHQEQTTRDTDHEER